MNKDAKKLLLKGVNIGLLMSGISIIRFVIDSPYSNNPIGYIIAVALMIFGGIGMFNGVGAHTIVKDIFRKNEQSDYRTSKPTKRMTNKEVAAQGRASSKTRANKGKAIYQKEEISEPQHIAPPEGMITVEEYASQKNQEVSTVIQMIRDGEYVGQIIEDQWYISTKNTFKKEPVSEEEKENAIMKQWEEKDSKWLNFWLKRGQKLML